MRDTDSHVCEQLLTLIHERDIALFEPTLVLLEVAGAISREFNNPVLGRISAGNLTNFSQLSFIWLNLSLATQGLEIAADERLRGADAAYVVVARHCSTTLVSLDQEHLRRAARIVPVLTPAEVLSTLA